MTGTMSTHASRARSGSFRPIRSRTVQLSPQRLSLFALLVAATASSTGCGSTDSFQGGDLVSSSSITTPSVSPGAYTLPRLFSMTSAQQRAVFSASKRGLGIGCGRVASAQLSAGSDLFLGREATPAGACPDGPWALTLYQLTGNTFTRVARILDTTGGISFVDASRSYTLTTAYDPATAVFAGQRWIVFECGGQGFGPTGSTCAAPLSEDGRTVDRGHLSVLVDSGNATFGDGSTFSASVPKLLSHKGRLYVYWTAVHANSRQAWLDLTTRGIEVEVRNGRLRVLGQSGPIKPNDSRSVEVWGVVEGDNRQNSVADMAQIFSDGERIYAMAGIGGWNKATYPAWSSRGLGDAGDRLMCLNPWSPVTGCYRLAIAMSTAPLERRGFNSTAPGRRVPDAVLPANPQSYAGLFTDATGQTWLMSYFLNQHSAPDPGKIDLGENVWALKLPAPGTVKAIETLITHYYTSILGRTPDAGGLNFWTNQASSKQAQGMDVKPVFRTIATDFYNSTEYRSKSKSNSAFVTDLYRTFFQREPDAGGLNFWLGYLATGATRSQVLSAFANSSEFVTFMQSLGF
ncbi:MAG: DUF4214 domain-containing protein [Deltaproteobacteria bacterium]|nr:DUF4214 domain-containing protein [Deltaproteobacteria bacterium]